MYKEQTDWIWDLCLKSALRNMRGKILSPARVFHFTENVWARVIENDGEGISLKGEGNAVRGEGIFLLEIVIYFIKPYSVLVCWPLETKLVML